MILEQFTIQVPHNGIVDHRSPPEAKIALFRALFRGREDVYPRRFESRKTGKTGYQPVCANEWVQGVCEKPSRGGRSSKCLVPISRPAVDAGELAEVKVGSHRRLRVAEIVTFKAARDAKRTSALDRLTERGSWRLRD